MKEKLQVREDEIPDLTFLEGTCDETIRCLQKIQKDKQKPTVYAKQPHDLTHLCVVGDTLVKTTRGYKRIKDLIGKKGKVYCLNNEGKIVKRRFFNPCMTSESAEVYEVELADGTKIKGTADHKVMTDSGWKRIIDLTPDDDVLQR